MPKPFHACCGNLELKPMKLTETSDKCKVQTVLVSEPSSTKSVYENGRERWTFQYYFQRDGWCPTKDALISGMKIESFEPKKWDLPSTPAAWAMKHRRGCAIGNLVERNILRVPTTIEPLQVPTEVSVGDRVGIGPMVNYGDRKPGTFCHFACKSHGFPKYCCILRRKNKLNDALELEADGFIATRDDQDWETKHAASLDSIISTVSSADTPMNKYLGLLRSSGHFCQIGMSEAPLPSLHVFPVVERKISIHFNDIGSVFDVENMLEFVAEMKMKPWVEERKTEDVNDVLRELMVGRIRY
ncbi:hypothetical protein BDZ45DRAFT_804633 [Acephala macrosclerotiorum]|nr:hypothetical protein BDZ45DRAFT_804633 [Acephala macrosclerotiorum]